MCRIASVRTPEGWSQTTADPDDLIVASRALVSGVDFGNIPPLATLSDFGDTPASYGDVAPGNRPEMELLRDAEPASLPRPSARTAATSTTPTTKTA